MKNLWDYIKDKSYYLLGGTVLIIILLIVISSCSSGNGGSYASIENKMVVAAKKYYSNNKNALPKLEGSQIRVTISTLVDKELLKEVKDPKDKSNLCSGYVEVTKVSNDYSYIPFLTCKGNYEPEYLTDKIKKSKQDELGNGLYEINGEYIYRGDDVNNYVSFNDMLFRIIKIDSSNNIKLVLNERTEDYYAWDNKYNSERAQNVGNTTNYLLTNIRKSLNEYYDKTFTKESKAKIVSKTLCVGKYSFTDNFSSEKECSIIKENEKIGLLNLMDYKNASLDSGCVSLKSGECTNRNYLANDSIGTWTLNSSSDDTYRVFYISNEVDESTASNEKRINPVIYLSDKVITNQGNGSLEKPYIIK